MDSSLSRLLITALVAGLAATIATAIGGLLAMAVQRLRSRRGLWSALLLIPFITPAAVWALGQTYCYGAGGLLERLIGDDWRPWLMRLNEGQYLAATLVLAQIHAPLVILLVGRGLGRMHQAGWESARLLLAGGTRFRWLLGGVWPELASGFLLAFAMSLGNFAAPHMLQCHLYSVDVYLRMTNYLDPRGALFLALPLCGVAFAAIAVMVLIECRQARGGSLSSFGEALSAPTPDVARNNFRPHWLAVAFLVVYAGVTIALPVAALVSECKSVDAFRAALRDAWPELQSTLAIAVAAATFALAFGLLVAGPMPRRLNEPVHALAIAPLALPPLVIGLVFLKLFQRSEPIDLAIVGDTSLLVMLGLAFRGWPFALRLTSAGRSRLVSAWYDSARLARVGSFRRMAFITAPPMLDYLLAGWLITYVLAVGDVEISQMLCAPGYGTLSLRLFTFLHFGPTHVAASLAVTLILLTVAPAFLYFLVANRCLRIL